MSIIQQRFGEDQEAENADPRVASDQTALDSSSSAEAHPLESTLAPLTQRINDVMDLQLAQASASRRQGEAIADIRSSCCNILDLFASVLERQASGLRASEELRVVLENKVGLTK